MPFSIFSNSNTLSIDSYIDLSYARKLHLTGKNIGIAILDSGLTKHRDMPNQTILFKDYINGQSAPYDDYGHGTHIAGIIGQIAPGATLLSLKVLNEYGEGNVSTLQRAVNDLIQNKSKYNIRIVNISLGLHIEKEIILRQTVERMVLDLISHDFIVCVSAGNEGPAPSTLTIPGTLKEVITVGSIDQYGYQKSSRDSLDCVICKPEVLAPGYRILSFKNDGFGYVKKSGTSMSTAFVSGAIALLLEQYPLLCLEEIKHLLTKNAYVSEQKKTVPQELNLRELLSYYA